MQRPQDLTIYLLKKGYTPQNCLRQDHGLVLGKARGLPKNAAAFVQLQESGPPDWCDWIMLEDVGGRSSINGIVFVRGKERTFALTFGHAYHKLLEESYEHDFGLLVILNGVDPEKLRSADSADPAAARLKRTQAPRPTDLTFLDFRHDTEVLKSLTGAMRDDLSALFESATGSRSLRLRTKLPAAEVNRLCNKIYRLYLSNVYEEIFPSARNLTLVRDPDEIQILDDRLITAIKTNSENVNLAVPELLEFDGAFSVSFGGAGRGAVYSDFYIGAFYDYLKKRAVSLHSLSIDAIKKEYKVHINFGSGQKHRSFSIYRCVIFETKRPDCTDAFHFLDGLWYRVTADYLKTLESDLDAHWIKSPLPAYAHATEGKYNEFVATTASNLVCLDHTNIAPKGWGQLEPCDILSYEKHEVTLIHVKVSTCSAQLSHLFNQGCSSIELLRSEPEALKKLQLLTNGRAHVSYINKIAMALAAGKMKVLFAVVTHKDPAQKSRNLPIFSRITLRRALKLLRAFQTPARFFYIENTLVAKDVASKGMGPAP
jgi:uncharacterized protein (TIGR04141 family)